MHLDSFQARHLRAGEIVFATLDATAERRGLLGRSVVAGTVVLTDVRLCFHAKRLAGETFEQISMLSDVLRYAPQSSADRVSARFETDAGELCFEVEGARGEEALGQLLGALARLREATGTLSRLTRPPVRTAGDPLSLQYQLMRLNDLRDGGLLTALEYARHEQRILYGEVPPG